MPTPDREHALSLDQARAHIGTRSFRLDPKRADGAGRIGLEPECFGVRVDSDGRPAGRLPLAEVLGTLDEVARSSADVLPRPEPHAMPPRYELVRGGTLTFEPGAQIEHSTAVRETGYAALSDAECLADTLTDAFAEKGARLAWCGVDLWHPVEAIAQELDAPRYHCMAAYLESRHPAGRTMMRHSASIQINLDLGPKGVAEERWVLSNLLSPLATASFASSPSSEAVSERAIAWQKLDPTRTGFPTGLAQGLEGDFRAVWAEAVLSADVMMFWKDERHAVPGSAGFTFERWIREGHPDYGWPTLEDLSYHLTTVFFEVRPRGFLELRASEALPRTLRAAPVVLYAGLLYEPAARRRALELLLDHGADLSALWHRAAVSGLADPLLLELAREVWPAALDGARSLPSGWFSEDQLETARGFLEVYSLQGRAPADDLRALLAQDPTEALEWAARGGDSLCPKRARA